MNRRKLEDSLSKFLPNNNFILKIASKMELFRIKRYMISDRDLVRRCELDSCEKTKLVQEYKEKWPNIWKNAKKQNKVLSEKSFEVKNLLSDKSVEEDIFFCHFAYGFSTEEYLGFGLSGQTYEERSAWISAREAGYYLYSLNDLKTMQLFNNKANTYEAFKPYYKRDVISVKTQSDYNSYEAFVKKHPEFVQKAVYEASGRSVELVDLRNGGAKQHFENLISKGQYVLEERVVQSDILARLNESSVNTVRCMTLNTRNGIVVPYCFMKVGRAGSFVDNGGAGGILVGIDKDTGVFDTNGFDELGFEYELHPDTGVRFKGFELPEWEALLGICIEMAKQTPRAKLIGWDLTYRPDGWIVIEGNGQTQLIGPQTVYKRGIKAEFEEYLKDVDRIV